MIRRRLFAAFFLIIVLLNGATELYVAALAAERAGIQFIPQWLRPESPLCIPRFYNEHTLANCECPRTRAIAKSPEGVPIAKSRRGEGIALSAIFFPVPGSLAFKFLIDQPALSPSWTIEHLHDWLPHGEVRRVSHAPMPETPPPRV